MFLVIFTSLFGGRTSFLVGGHIQREATSTYYIPAKTAGAA